MTQNPKPKTQRPTPRILTVGVGPTPPFSKDKLYAPGLRLWITASTLATAGLDVICAEADFEGKTPPIQHIETIQNPSIRHTFLPPEPQKAIERIRTLHAEFKFDAAISSTDVMNDAIVRSGINCPRWLDFFGLPTAERQLQAAIYHSDDGLAGQWLTIIPALLCGDHYSTATLAAKHALIGQLGAVGRLNQFDAHHDLVSILYPTALIRPLTHTRNLYRGTIVPQDAIVILWMGGYNTWADVETLFSALESVMGTDARIHYVSTGGAIRGHNDVTFERFRKMVAASPFEKRYHFLGWIPKEDVDNAMLEADVAVNIDTFSYEGIFGCRNRIFTWLNAALPVITTDLGETTHDLVERGLVDTFPIGDASALTKRIFEHIKNPEKYHQQAKEARIYLTENLAPEKIYAPLIAWAKNPTRAPDLQKTRTITTPEGFAIPDNPLSKMMLDFWRSGGKIISNNREIQRLRERLSRIEGKRVMKLYRFFFGDR